MSNEIYVLDLDEEFMAHLVIPESWFIIQTEDVSYDLIEDEFIRAVYEYQKQHFLEEGKIATASVLADEFEIDLVEPETAINDLIGRLRVRYLKNKGREALKSAIALQNEDPSAVPGFLLKRGRELQAISSRRGEAFDQSDYDRAIYLYDKKVNEGPGASLGYDELNEYFYGQRGLTFVIAPPKAYKSWFLINNLVSNVLGGDLGFLYSLELPAHETDMRLRCLLANVPFWRYLKNAFSPEQKAAIKDASKHIEETGYYKIIKPPLGQRSIDQIVDNAGNAGANMVLIDQLQYVEVDGKSLGELNNTGDYFGVINRARDLSDQIPIMIAHQFNRQSMYTDEMPDIRFAKGSSSIEEAATLALGLWASKEHRRLNRLELGTLISRNYMYASWDMQVELSQGCSFKILGRKQDESE
jgi:hypothetical protein